MLCTHGKSIIRTNLFSEMYDNIYNLLEKHGYTEQLPELTFFIKL